MQNFLIIGTAYDSSGNVLENVNEQIQSFNRFFAIAEVEKRLKFRHKSYHRFSLDVDNNLDHVKDMFGDVFK